MGLTLQLKTFDELLLAVKLTSSVDILAFQIIGRAELAEATECPTNCDLPT